MQKLITLPDALAFQLQGLIYAETKVREEFLSCSSHVASAGLADELKKYAESSSNKLIKLERVFNYLMVEMHSRRNEAIESLIGETRRIMEATFSSHLRDILMIGCAQSINAYKSALYRSAYMFAAELELDVAVDLLQQILEWETKSGKVLAALAIEEFNKVQRTLN